MKTSFSRIYLVLCFLGCISFCCKKKSAQNSHIIQFMNNSGYIKVHLDTFFNDFYTDLAVGCTGYEYVHVLKNKNCSRPTLGNSLAKEMTTKCHIYISYSNKYDNPTLKEMEAKINKYFVLSGPNYKPRNWIETFGKYDFIFEYGHGDRLYPTPLYHRFSAKNSDISISGVSTLHTEQQFRTLICNLLENLEYKFDKSKLNSSNGNFESSLQMNNNINSYKEQ